MEVQVGVRLCLGDTVVDFVYFAGRNEPEQLVGGGCRMRGGNGILLPDQETAERITSMGGKFLWDDCKEVPEIQTSIYHYPKEKKIIQFEVRNWCTNLEDGAGVGNIFYGWNHFAMPL